MGHATAPNQPFPRISAALAAALLIVAAPPAWAETAAPPGASAPGAETAAEADPTARVRELVEATQAGINEVLALDPLIAEASGEQHAVLVEEQRVKREAAGATFRELIDEVARLRQEGIEDPAATEKATDFVERIEQWSEEQLKGTAAELEQLEKAREDAADEDLFEIEEQLADANAKYDGLLAGWLRLCTAREEIGLDAAAQYARLDELLDARARQRSGQVRVTRKRIVDYTEKIAGADEEEAKRLQQAISRFEEQLDERTASLQQVVDLMEARGLPSAEYRQLLIEATGEITADIFKREVAVGLVQRWWRDAKEWLASHGPGLVFKALLAAAILFAFHVVGRVAQRIVRRALQSAKVSLSRLLQDFALSTTYRVVIGLGVLIALSQLGVQIGPLLAGLGVAGFIVGFALQDTLANFASGMMILAYRPFDVGDVVTAGGVAGKVAQMTLVTTTILTFDNQRLIVPNTKIWGDIITNVTAERVRRVDLVFGIGYSDDIEHAERVLRDIVESHDKVLKDPAPTIKLHELGDSSVNFVVRPWAQTVDYWDVYWDVTREVKRRFDAEGISIPFPQRDVHVHPKALQEAAGTDA